MSITAYFGVPGSGKSHECVKNVILPAYLQGRRIVTNIDGINSDAIRDYAVKLSKGKPCVFGEVIKVIDEVWRFWKSDKNLTYEHESFISEHRHFTDSDTGLCCDLVLMNQSPDTIARIIKGRIETSYKMTKLVMIGARNRYRVDVYNEARLYKTNKITSYQNKYDKNIFKLYHSYNGGKGNEATVDSRQNIFSQTKLWVSIFGFLLLLSCSGYFINSFFTGYTDDNPVVSGVNNNDVLDKVSSHNGSKYDNNNLRERSGTERERGIENPVSSSWRISGVLNIDNYIYVTLVNSSGDIRMVNKTDFYGKGIMMFGFVDGEKVTYFSGVSK
ncbi:hypothetical protein L7750_19485 [Xenorhabdus bovienii]|uniref:zonular occludens toxin domain-containing protein n=1 Tax=Xenorhabdus bovienii TaxID=40576 RepID=UPI001EE0628A|nr:zonular occludens toxin domain-containing protein [Xenorhabdus bovienii]MCG3472469.1 hypothetical protein [Xenorhabdus bovienii]